MGSLRLSLVLGLMSLTTSLRGTASFFPVDPGSVRSVAVGGAVANSAGEMRGAKYGAMRDWVPGLRVVTDKGTS
jgi:D-lactate dehydrogenase (cytochrome)/glycolate oxidase